MSVPRGRATPLAAGKPLRVANTNVKLAAFQYKTGQRVLAQFGFDYQPGSIIGPSAKDKGTIYLVRFDKKPKSQIVVPFSRIVSE